MLSILLQAVNGWLQNQILYYRLLDTGVLTNRDADIGQLMKNYICKAVRIIHRNPN